MSERINRFVEKFRRITSGQAYLPQIDGLRFISVFWVVWMMHTVNVINVNLYHEKLFENIAGYWQNVMLEGAQGVNLFFMISGFILIIPFIKRELYNYPVSLKSYYLRRLSRLEPPYIAALLISFVLLVWVAGKYSFQQLFPGLLASSVYIYQFVYGQRPLVLGVAWSLEVEAQFYLLVPFFGLFFKIHNHFIRRLVVLLLIIAGTILAPLLKWLSIPTLVQCYHYFFAGILLADWYCTPPTLILFKKPLWGWVGLCCIIFLPLLLATQGWIYAMIKFALLVFIFYLSLFNPLLKKWLSNQCITIIGGMCYSIYLIHMIILSGFSKYFIPFHAYPSLGNFLLYFFFLSLSVLIFSAIFYRLIEQPCMRRGWWKLRRE